MVYGIKDATNMIKEYTVSRKWLDDVQVEIVGGENNIDPLTLLRVYENDVTVDNNMILVDGFCKDRVIRFHRKNKLLLEVQHRAPGDLQESLKDEPYLLDLLCKTCYSLMLKKLTPPSEDLETEDGQ